MRGRLTGAQASGVDPAAVKMLRRAGGEMPATHTHGATAEMGTAATHTHGAAAKVSSAAPPPPQKFPPPPPPPKPPPLASAAVAKQSDTAIAATLVVIFHMVRLVRAKCGKQTPDPPARSNGMPQS